MHRIHSLDSLRGVAALVVIFNHLFSILPAHKDIWLMQQTPLHWLIDGRAAVLLFFVLSGCVLAMPFFGGYKQDYPTYALRRVTRIYLPYFVVLLVAAGLYALTVQPGGGYQPDGGGWENPLTFDLFLSHLIMSGVQMKSVSLDPPAWSLIIEMRISLIFPLLVLLMRPARAWLILPVAFAVGYGATKLILRLDGLPTVYTGETPRAAALLTVYYIPFFLVGILIAKHMQDFAALMRRLPVWLHILGAAVIVLVPTALLKQHFIVSELWYAGIAAYLVLCCVSFDRVKSALAWQPVAWLGKVSYSLYLIHMPVLLATLHLLHDVLPLYACLLIAFPAMLLAAAVTYRWVEMPAIALGRRLSRKKSNAAS